MACQVVSIFVMFNTNVSGDETFYQTADMRGSNA